MKIWKMSFIFILMVFISVISCFFYAFKIEPYLLEVNEYKLNEGENTKIGLKIVQFSDLHIKENFTHKNVEKIVHKINAQKPDIVVFTGDLYDNYAKYNEDLNVIEQLNDIKAKYGKIAIWGNRDYGGGAVRQYETIMNRSGFTLLKNKAHVIALEKEKKLLISGVDDLLLGDPSLPDISNISQSDYKILLTHESDIVDNFKDANYDLILSGHSHGGQIRVPFFPGINKKALSRTAFSSKYSEGIYQFEENDSTLYVNTGIGTTHISARFGVAPEIAIFQL